MTLEIWPFILMVPLAVVAAGHAVFATIAYVLRQD